MVSRRSLLQASGAALAAGGLGMGLPNPAGAAESVARPLLPSFGRPAHLDVADVSTLDGHDQLLLTTLQGVVNRRRPRL
ncbi:twin-arginine translocation signal domain-containing protein [Streptomyces sp. NPDC056105]|uniref:twin-arginine translocation signal domain-containing protein n=1 Tax=Streptomyces sp. NPDC056105 TaxID=3345714 RepID=UPI0035D712D4